MFKWNKMSVALPVTLLMTVLVTVLRVTLVPWLQKGENAVYSYVIVGTMVATMIGIFALLRAGRCTLPVLPTATGDWVFPVGFALIAVGGCIAFSTVYDIYQYAFNGIAPPPAHTVSSGVDRIALLMCFVCGVLAGIYFISLGIRWLIKGEQVSGMMPILALAPTFWVWTRLARYEVSYASAVEVYQSFYDFGMLLMSMLFLFTFARQVANVQAKKPYITIFFALCTVFLGVSGSLARICFFLSGDGDAYRAGQLAGIADLAVGILAGVFAVLWLCGVKNYRTVAISQTSKTAFFDEDEQLEDLSSEEAEEFNIISMLRFIDSDEEEQDD